MSRWLKSVNTLLEKLDDTVGERIEEHEAEAEFRRESGGDEPTRVALEHSADVGGGGAGVGVAKSSVDDILAKRGLVEDEEEEEEEAPKTSSEATEEKTVEESDAVDAANNNKEALDNESGAADDGVAVPPAPRSTEASSGDAPAAVAAPTVEAAPESGPPAEKNNEVLLIEETTAAPEVALLHKQLAQQKATAERALAESQKEVRKLRRNLVKMNSELENSETEMDAQRVELTRAAERLERDRVRHKEEKSNLEKQFKAQLEGLQKEHKQALEALTKSHKDKLSEMEKQMKRLEETRQREGGDYTKELSDSLERERETMRKLMIIEDEKSTLVQQVTSLEGQISSLESRLSSTVQNAELATDREREADDRLDAALSLHARQMSQRQAREAELERTIADLGAALVVARQRAEANGTSEERRPSAAAQEGADEDQDEFSMKEKLIAAEDELDTLRAQLDLERQRSETLQQELLDVNNERTEEAASAQARQKQYDRQVADLTGTVSRLQLALRAADVSQSPGDLLVEPPNGGAEKNGDDDSLVVFRKRYEQREADLHRQISALSEQILLHQKKNEKVSSELTAVKNRLRAAVTRAETAEKSLATNGGGGGIGDVDMEMGSGPLFGAKGGMRKRGMGRSGTQRVPSMRSALRMDPGRVGESQEQLAQVVDAIDRWCVDTGTYLRYNPLARLALFLYLLLLHLWTFFLFLFHQQQHLENHASAMDSGAHGPQSLLQNSYRHMEQAPRSP